MPGATIVIPLLDQVDAWLEQCVRSALAQTIPAEVIVVHSDRARRSNLTLLRRLARRHRELRLAPEPIGGGFPHALNRGIQLARAERVGFLLSDDWLDPRAIERCLPERADIVSTSHTAYLADGATVLPEASAPRRLEELRALATLEEQATYLTHFFLLRRTAVLAVGGLDETLGNYPGIDDFDLVWTMLEHGASVSIVEHSLYNYRDHEGLRLTLTDREPGLRTLEAILAKHGLTGDEKVRVLAKHAPWLGRTVSVVAAEELARR